MTIVWARRLSAAVCMCLSITSCGGGTQHSTPGTPPLTPANNGRTVLSNSTDCSIPLINLVNSTASPMTFAIDPLKVQVPCNASGKLFGATAFQSSPQPAKVKPTKLADATGQGHNVTFSPIGPVTVPANSTFAIAILAEKNTSYVAFPIAPGSTTFLTPPAFPTSLSFSYASATSVPAGALVYSAGCFPGVPQPAPPQVGTSSFYCNFDAGTSTITFLGTPADPAVKFFIGAPRADASVLGLDGTPGNFVCTSGAIPECDTPQFSISSTTSTNVFNNVIVGNVNDLRMCVPVTDNTDCNALVNPAPSRTIVTSNRSFQLLIADDSTYQPNAGPWDGIFHGTTATNNVTASGSCHITTSADNNNPKAPPGYTDNGQQAVGPLAELDVTPNSTGTCTITVSEDPKYITDFSNPANPTGRTVTLTVTIGS
jgi:hypothetical protein